MRLRVSRRLQALFGAYLRPGVPARLRRTAAACAARLAGRAGGADAMLAQALGAIKRERASAVRCGSPEAPWSSRSMCCPSVYGRRGICPHRYGRWRCPECVGTSLGAECAVCRVARTTAAARDTNM
jgi:hypothetical protein